MLPQPTRSRTNSGCSSRRIHRVRDVNSVAGYNQYDMFPKASTMPSNTGSEMREIQVPTPTSYCASTHKSPAYRDSDGPEYPAWRGRTPSCHPRRQSPEFEVVELMRLDPLHLFFTGFLPPFFGAVASIVVALMFHNDEISNYNWQCGRARLPSLSRIINLPMERIFWQFTFLFHIPLRIVELAVGFYRYGRLRSVDCRFPRFYTLSRYLYATFGTFELIFMVALSVVGEREFIGYHVIFFYLFGLFAIGFFVTNVICHASSLYYLNPYGRRSYYIKIVFTILYIISVPILLTAFLLYWKRCITYMYDVFAITEYVDVFLSIGYHCCAFYDIRHKVIFSFRNVKPVKRD